MENINSFGFESTNDLKSVNSSYKETPQKKTKMHFQLESSLDLVNFPLRNLLKVQNLSLSGAYYKKIVKELVEPLETKKILQIDPTKRWIKPDISTILFKVQATTSFGDCLLITGSAPQIGCWSVHHKMVFSEGMWIKEIIDLRKNSNDSLKPKTDSSTEYFGRGSVESLSQIGIKNNSDFEDLNFEFKFIISQNGNYAWESISNRKFSFKDNIDILENLINSPDSEWKNGLGLLSYYQESMTFIYNQKTKSLVIQCYFNK